MPLRIEADARLFICLWLWNFFSAVALISKKEPHFASVRLHNLARTGVCVFVCCFPCSAPAPLISDLQRGRTCMNLRSGSFTLIGTRYTRHTRGRQIKNKAQNAGKHADNVGTGRLIDSCLNCFHPLCIQQSG